MHIHYNSCIRKDIDTVVQLIPAIMDVLNYGFQTLKMFYTIMYNILYIYTKIFHEFVK